ncbi:MAG: SGNH/GDSL hydrolase family protein [Planctomycetes bacterium]|nr:SGNH/GDSL hydrolase family protein [Planctomycetota bacterium]
MIRSFFRWIKHLAYAVVMLAILACLTEIGLRVYDSATAQVTRRDLYDRGLVCKNWFYHHSLKPSRVFSVKNLDSGERVRVAINSFGVRGPEPEIPKPRDVFRIICLGDESTFAPAVEESDTFCGQMQQMLAEKLGRPVEVINAGIPDFCPLLSYLQFRHSLLALEPDLVVVNFDPTDVADDYQIRRYAVLDRDGDPLSCAHPSLEMPRRGKSSRESVVLFPQFARQKINQLLAEQTLSEKSRSIESQKCRYLWLEDSPPDWSSYIDQSFSPIRQLDDLARSRGIKLVVAMCPAPWQISAQASNGEGVREQAGVNADACFQSRRPFELLSQFCQSSQISFCDVSQAFLNDRQPDRFFQSHVAAFSVDGHGLYAQELARFVLEHEFGARDRQDRDGYPRPIPQAGLSSQRTK